jgi:hypothetical protein
MLKTHKTAAQKLLGTANNAAALAIGHVPANQTELSGESAEPVSFPSLR